MSFVGEGVHMASLLVGLQLRDLSSPIQYIAYVDCLVAFLSASLYVSKRGDYEIGCVVTSLVVGRWLVGWLVVGCHARALWPNGAS